MFDFHFCRLGIVASSCSMMEQWNNCWCRGCLKNAFKRLTDCHLRLALWTYVLSALTASSNFVTLALLFCFLSLITIIHRYNLLNYNAGMSSTFKVTGLSINVLKIAASHTHSRLYTTVNSTISPHTQQGELVRLCITVLICKGGALCLSAPYSQQLQYSHIAVALGTWALMWQTASGDCMHVYDLYSSTGVCTSIVIKHTASHSISISLSNTHMCSHSHRIGCIIARGSLSGKGWRTGLSAVRVFVRDCRATPVNSTP